MRCTHIAIMYWLYDTHNYYYVGRQYWPSRWPHTICCIPRSWYTSNYHHVLGVWPCISGCEYEGSTICSALPPAPGCWLVHGLPSRTSTGTATRLGEDRALAAAAAWCSTCMPFSCCARFVLYLWFWNQIFTWNNVKNKEKSVRLLWDEQSGWWQLYYAYIIVYRGG